MKWKSVSLIAILALLGGSVCTAVQAAASGHLTGVVRDQAGQPLSNLLVSLVATGAAEALPVLTRTGDQGELTFRDIEPGTYEVAITSSRYQTPTGRYVQIEAGETASIKLVLQQLLALGGDEPNVGIKTLLRSANARRLIFRTTPDPAGLPEGHARFFDRAAVQVYTNTGLGSDSFSYPGGPVEGTTTSFAVREPVFGGRDTIVAGQLNSGVDSSWRIKNYFNHDLGENHSLQIFMGYGRLSVDQPGYSLAQDFVVGGEIDSSGATARIFSVGLEDQIQFGDFLEFHLGVELDQVRHGQSRYFISPSARIEFKPLESSRFHILMASKRNTQGNTVTLPDGEQVSLADAVFLSYQGDEVGVGSARHYEAAFEQMLGENSSVELAAFRNELSGAMIPLLGFDGGTAEMAALTNRQAETQGYRVGFSQNFGENFKARVSYIRAQGFGFSSGVDEVVVADSAQVADLLTRQSHHAVSTELDAFIPASQTRITALLKAVPGGSPVTTLDSFRDFRDTSNQGVNLFVRQIVPVPTALLGFLGLDFLSDYKLEILLDVRNLTNEQIASLQSGEGSLVLLQRPRTVRGGISLNF